MESKPAQHITIDAFQVDQPIGVFYVGRVLASDLFKICKFDFRQMTFSGGYVKFLGIQRELNPKRCRDISAYAKTMDACFPTAIVISIPDKCVEIADQCDGLIQRLTISGYDDPLEPELSVSFDEIATIIDGQHRLKGIEGAEKDIELPVSIFVGFDDAVDASIFSIVNLAQTKVNKSLVYDLFELAKSRSPEKTCHEIVVALDQIKRSPFENRVKRLGAATEGRSGETLAQATMVRGLLPYLTSDALADRDRGRRFGFWDPINGPEKKRRIFRDLFIRKEDDKITEILLNYFGAIQDRWPEAWSSTGRGNMINRTNGYNAFMRFLRPAYRYFTEESDIVTKSSFRSLFDRVKLEDDDFNIRRFIPGTGGAKLLYDELVAQSGVSI